MKKISITKVDVETTLKQRNLVLTDYALQEDLLRDTFDKYKHNDDYGQILTKVTLLNLLYSTGIMDVKGVADHIFKHGKDIDSLMKKGDPTVVHLIAKVEHNGKPINHFSFATKYCSFHYPDKYPIYDDLVYKVLAALRTSLECGSFSPEKIKDKDYDKHAAPCGYALYKTIYDRFIELYAADFPKKDYKTIDCYLWGSRKIATLNKDDWRISNNPQAYKAICNNAINKLFK